MDTHWQEHKHSASPNGATKERGGRNAPPPPDWELFTYGDSFKSERREYLIKGLVNRGDFSAWYGPPKHGKSFVLLDLMLHIAAGRPWRGKRVRQGRVLYCALEGGFGIRNRIVAAQGKFGTAPLPFHILAVPLNLLNGDGAKLAAFMMAKAEEFGGDFDVVVVDTLSRSMPGGKENSPEVMSAVVGALDVLRHETKAHIAVIHHCGKDEAAGLRGHSSLLGALDLVVFIKSKVMRVEDARDMAEGDEWGFTLRSVTIGTDDEGDVITSCVVEEAEIGAEKGGDSAKPRRPRGKNQQTVLDAFYKAVSGAADEPPADPLVPRKACGIWREKWKEAAMPQLTQPTAKLKREAFDDAVAHLRDQGFIRHHNGFFWMPLGSEP
jgi:hypothetical protein